MKYDIFHTSLGHNALPLSALADMIQAALMLKYNHRKVG